MSENQNGTGTKKSAWAGFGKALVMVIIAVFVISIFGGVMHLVVRLIVAAVVVLVIGVLFYGLFGARKH